MILVHYIKNWRAPRHHRSIAPVVFLVFSFLFFFPVPLDAAEAYKPNAQFDDWSVVTDVDDNRCWISAIPIAMRGVLSNNKLWLIADPVNKNYMIFIQDNEFMLNRAYLSIGQRFFMLEQYGKYGVVDRSIRYSDLTAYIPGNKYIILHIAGEKLVFSSKGFLEALKFANDECQVIIDKET